MTTYLIVIALVAGVVAGWFLVRYLKGRRLRSLAGMAEVSGAFLDDYGPEVKLLEGTGLPFFVDGRGGFGHCLLRLEAEDGAKFYFFDYHCTLGFGAAERKRQSTVALFAFDKGAFPDFHLSAGGDLPDEASGLEPVDMKEFPGFPAGVKLLGRDAAALKKYFTTELGACFAEHPGWSAQGSGRYLVLYKGGGLVPTGAYKGFIAEAKKLAFNLA
jgi:hypothetical protein